MTHLEVSLDQNYWSGQGIVEVQSRYFLGEEVGYECCIDPQSVGSIVKVLWDDNSQGLYRVTAVHENFWVVDLEEVR